MSGQFKVGEVLVGQHFTITVDRNGMECVVLEGLRQRLAHCGATGESLGMQFIYKVEWANGVVTGALPQNLRRKQPLAGEQSVLDMFQLPSPSKEIA